MVRLRFLLLLLAVLMVLSACGTSDTILPGEQSKENMLAALVFTRDFRTTTYLFVLSEFPFTRNAPGVCKGANFLLY